MSLPDMSDAIDGLGDPITLAVIGKAPVDFESQETITQFRRVYGVKMPTNPRELSLLPEGERNWKYLTIYSADTTIENDDYVRDDADGLTYRVLAYEPWQGAHYRKYLLQQAPRAGSAVFTENLAAEGANS